MSYSCRSEYVSTFYAVHETLRRVYNTTVTVVASSITFLKKNYSAACRKVVIWRRV